MVLKSTYADDKQTFEFKLILLSLVYDTFHPLLHSSDNLHTRETLKDFFHGISFIVEDLNPKVEEDGLTTYQIQQVVETILSTAGIRVLSDDEYCKTERRPLLIIDPHVMKLQSDLIKTTILYVYHISIQFSQRIYILQDPILETWATTWASDLLGYTPDLDNIRGSVTEMVEQFIQAFLFVNPKHLLQEQ